MVGARRLAAGAASCAAGQALGGLGASVAFVTLVRPGTRYLAAPLLAAAVSAALAAARRWRRPLAGGPTGERGVRAVRRCDGRLRAAGAEQGGFGLHFALPDELRALNGPTLCRPCTIGVRYPGLDLWWFLLPALVRSASGRAAALARRRVPGSGCGRGVTAGQRAAAAVCGLAWPRSICS